MATVRVELCQNQISRWHHTFSVSTKKAPAGSRKARKCLCVSFKWPWPPGGVLRYFTLPDNEAAFFFALGTVKRKSQTWLMQSNLVESSTTAQGDCDNTTMKKVYFKLLFKSLLNLIHLTLLLNY